MSWVLLLFISAGPMAGTQADVSVTSVRFYQEDSCKAGGADLARLASSTVQQVKYVCIHDGDTQP
jgi:hypothetical protein